MSALLTLIAVVSIVLGVVGCVAGFLSASPVLSIYSFVGGMLSGLVFFALSRVLDRLETIIENQENLAKAWNARDNAERRTRQERQREFPNS